MGTLIRGSGSLRYAREKTRGSCCGVEQTFDYNHTFHNLALAPTSVQSPVPPNRVKSQNSWATPFSSSNLLLGVVSKSQPLRSGSAVLVLGAHRLRAAVLPLHILAMTRVHRKHCTPATVHTVICRVWCLGVVRILDPSEIVLEAPGLARTAWRLGRLGRLGCFLPVPRSTPAYMQVP